MAVTEYEKNGQKLWRVYYDLHSKKDPRVRVQKRINGVTTKKEADSIEKNLIRTLADKLSKLEAQGSKWEDVIERWETHQRLYPSKKYVETTIRDHASLLRNWTKMWMGRVASELNRGDGREVLRFAEAQGKKANFRKRLKNTINVVYTWGIEERLIPNVHESPVFGIQVDLDREEKVPEILSLEEIRNLLRKAKEQNFPWYPIWVMATLTGARSGELHALRKNDLEIVSPEDATHQEKLPKEKRRYGLIRVRRTWNTKVKDFGPTKAGYWRNVPISGELYWFLRNDLKIDEKKPDDFALPHFWEWDKGEQARILRGFCVGNGLPSIKFHTLRACFATQLISSGIPGTVVMKICGWRDMKTMQRYIRMAGIDESGATENLHFIPTEEVAMEKVVSLFDFKRSR